MLHLQILNKQSLEEAISQIPNLLQTVGAKNASNEEVAKAQLLFAQSSSLKCRCSVQENEKVETCQQDLECSAGMSLWIELNTNSFPDETSFAITDISYDNSVLLEPTNTSNGVVEWWFDNVAANFPPLNATGHFSWQPVVSSTMKQYTSYTYTTCIPENTCAAIDGILFPGKFDIYIEGRKMGLSDDSEPFTYCLYHFGFCEERATCVSSPSILPPTSTPSMSMLHRSRAAGF